MKTAIVGGGAAGFFAAVNLKEMVPEMEVDIFERSQRVLAKVKVSGGGRCNCTNSFADVGSLAEVYPRGHRLLKRLFHDFDHRAAYEWFERHGVALTTQDDGCVFPMAQDSQAVIDCFLREARRHHINIHTRAKVDDPRDLLAQYDYVVMTTGGMKSGTAATEEHPMRWGHEVVRPVPSLFSLSISDSALCALMGTVVDEATVFVPGTRLSASGALLITHWGVSGPAVLRLSSYAARELAAAAYRVQLGIRWVSGTDDELARQLHEAMARWAPKQVGTVNPFGLSQRLWGYLVRRALGDRGQLRWSELGKKDVNRLANVVGNDVYQTAGRAAFKDEFVTCGGIALTEVNSRTLESNHVEHLYFAGEVLDVDGVTGGFNFQAAWTTAYTVARSIASFT